MIPSLRRLLVPLFITLLLLAGGATWWTSRGGAAAPPVYAALGASDSVGVGADNPATEGWVPRVHAGLPAGTQLLNLGISGATLGDILAQEVPPAVDARPRWVTVWTGVNDLRGGVVLETFAAQLDELLGHFSQSRGEGTGSNGSPVIVVLNIPDVRHLPAFAAADPAMLDRTVQSWNATIASAARRHGAILVDLHARWPELAEHPEYISSDGFHPSSAGYRRIAELVLDAMNQHVSAIAP